MVARKEPLKEEDIAALVVDHLISEGWEVYQEVPLGAIADIVVKQQTRSGATLLGVVEVKTAMNLTLLSQADNWVKTTNFVWVAYLGKRPSKTTQFGIRVAKQNGFGILKVYRGRVVEESAPTLRRKRSNTLLKCLREEHKLGGGYAKAGSQTGVRFTAFRETVVNLQRIVRNNPGITLKQALSEFKHHYRRDSVAIACLSKYIQKGVIEGIVEKVDEQNRITLHTIGD